MKTRMVTALLFVTAHTAAIACPLCEKQQPRLLHGITQGTTPESEWDWIFVGIALSITVYLLLQSVKLLVRSREVVGQGHIRKSFL